MLNGWKSTLTGLGIAVLPVLDGFLHGTLSLKQAAVSAAFAIFSYFVKFPSESADG